MEQVVQIAKVLSDINRVKIIALMQREKELCVCEICDTLELSQPLVSRHLKQMREAKLVQTRKDGKWMVYSLSSDKIPACFYDIMQKEAELLPVKISCATR